MDYLHPLVIEKLVHMLVIVTQIIQQTLKVIIVLLQFYNKNLKI